MFLAAMFFGNHMTKRKLLLCEILLKPESSRFTRATSMHLLALNNGYTRLLPDLLKLTKEAGFNLDSVYQLGAVDMILELSSISGTFKELL